MNVIKTRKVYTPDFKAKLGLEALSAHRTVNEIAQSYEVHPVQVGQWKRENEHPRPKGRGITALRLARFAARLRFTVPYGHCICQIPGKNTAPRGWESTQSD